MATAIIIFGLSLGCILGGCAEIRNDPYYQTNIQPHVDATKKFIVDNLDEDQDYWDRQEIN